MSRLTELFEDEKLITKIKKRLPYLFQLAELESLRAGKTGMGVSVRESYYPYCDILLVQINWDDTKCL